MKKISIIMTILILTLSLCACGRKEEVKPTETLPAQAQPATAPSVVPNIDPTTETNIPDQNVEATTHSGDNSMTEETRNTEELSGPQNNGNELSKTTRSRMGSMIDRYR